jgi:iron complex outermembrane receptor protein
VVYSGAYLVRNVEQQQDYTNYSRGVFATYYQCAGLSKTSPPWALATRPAPPGRKPKRTPTRATNCASVTPDDWRVRGIAGLYWEEFKIYDDTDWTYKTVPTCSAAETTSTASTMFSRGRARPRTTPNERGDNVGFFDDTTRTILQRAGFGSVTSTSSRRPDPHGRHSLLPLRVKGIGRRRGQLLLQAVQSPTTYFGPCTSATNGNGQQGGRHSRQRPYGTNLNVASYNNSTYHGFRSRANLSWHVTDDILLYYTWSQGFRPGGFNRGVKYSRTVRNYQYDTPTQYRPDT